MREHGSEFVFVDGLPDGEAAVLHASRAGATRATSNSFDLLFRGVEIVTGGQRLHRYERLRRGLRCARRDRRTPYGGYLQAFKHGMPPHGGFAIGLERWIARLAGAENVRETTLFPRDRHRLTP